MRKRNYILKSFISFLYLLSIGKVQSQNLVQYQFDQLEKIRDFYSEYSRQYAKGLFGSIYPARSMNTFVGTQMMAPSAFSLEIRGGATARFPASLRNEAFDSLNRFKNINPKMSYSNGIGTGGSIFFQNWNEGVDLIEQFKFTLMDENNRPLNTTANGKDSVSWQIPGWLQMGITEDLVPTYSAVLHWAPGYAFQLGGTYLLYNTSPSTNSGLVDKVSNRFYNIYFAHDFLYWWQAMHYKGWHLTGSFQLSNYSQNIAVNPETRFYQDYRWKDMNVWFQENITRVDFFNRTLQYSLKAGKSWHNVEAWAGATYMYNFGGLSNDGFITAYIDPDVNREDDGVYARRWRQYFFSGISDYTNIAIVGGATIGQKAMRVSAQYSVLTNGMHQGSIALRYVFYDTEKHPWQKDKDSIEQFDPSRNTIIKKRIIIELDEDDPEYVARLEKLQRDRLEKDREVMRKMALKQIWVDSVSNIDSSSLKPVNPNLNNESKPTGDDKLDKQETPKSEAEEKKESEPDPGKKED